MDKIDKLIREIREMLEHTPQPKGIVVNVDLGLWRRLVYPDLKVTALNKKQRLKVRAMRKVKR